MSLNLRAWPLAALFFISGLSFAEPGKLSALLQLLDEKQLAQTSEWRALVHYRKDGKGWLSEADDVRFFNAQDGSVNPEAELKATLKALFNPDVSLGDKHPQCRFPARLEWLQQALPFDPAVLPKVECVAFNEWYQYIKPAGVTIVFPAAYLNNPSSMFGHTLLRVDRQDQTERERLLAYSLGYAANVTPGSSALAYVFKGLFGGYPGTLSGAPYYDKVIEYSDIEARDIWEYELNLQQHEVDQLVRHAWELQFMEFDYFFFDENCSYRLLTILEVARPGVDLSSIFSSHAIPADTVRQAQKEGMVRGKSYRPAVVTRILGKLEQLSSEEQSLAHHLGQGEMAADSAELQGMEELSRARVIDLAYEYSRYLAQKNSDRRESLRSVSFNLLQARSELPTEIWQESTTEPVSPEHGHDTARINLALGQMDGRDYQSLRMRPAFHDILDDGRGYTSGAQIDFLDLELRHYSDLAGPEDDDWQMESLRLLDIKSFSPRNRFFKPLSWQVNAGWYRQHEVPSDHTRFILDTGMGASYGVRDKVILYGLLGLGFRSRSNLIDNYEWFASATVGLLYEFDSGAKFAIEGRGREYDGFNISDGYTATAKLNLPLGRNYSLRAEYAESSFEEIEFDEWRLGWQKYF